MLSSLQRIAQATLNREFLGVIKPEDLEGIWAKFSSDQLYSWASAELDTKAVREGQDAASQLQSILDFDTDFNCKRANCTL